MNNMKKLMTGLEIVRNHIVFYRDGRWYFNPRRRHVDMTPLIIYGFAKLDHRNVLRPTSLGLMLFFTWEARKQLMVTGEIEYMKHDDGITWGSLRHMGIVQIDRETGICTLTPKGKRCLARVMQNAKPPSGNV